MANVLSSELAVSMRRLGMSNEEVLQEVLEFAEMMEDLTLATRIRARELQEMEIISEEVRRW